MSALSLTAGSRVRLDCELAIRRLTKCRRLAARLMDDRPHCKITQLNFHRASRLTSEVHRAVSRLDATLNSLLEDDTIVLEPIKTQAGEGSDQLAEEEGWEPPWIVKRTYSAASTAVGEIVRVSSGPAAATAEAAFNGAKRSATATYVYAKPKVVSAVQYLVSPSGMLNAGATASAFSSLQLATLATACSTASVSANGLAAVLHTSAEVVQATGSTGAIRQALRDPNYAKDLQEILNQKREAKQRRRLVDTISVWASFVNQGAVARVSPLASRVVSGTGRRFAWLLGVEEAEGDCETSSSDAHKAAASKKSYLLESSRVALFVNAWVSTTLHAQVHAFRDTPENSVQNLVMVAGKAAEYRQLGWYDGSKAAYGDVLRPAFSAAASTSLTLGRQACESAWYCATHPFSTLSSVLRPAAAQ